MMMRSPRTLDSPTLTTPSLPGIDLAHFAGIFISLHIVPTKFAPIAIALSAILSLGTAMADTIRESYVAVLSDQDHLNSNGKRLTTAAAIIRQDRANFHRFGKRDHGDQSDSFFADAKNRALLEQYIARGTSNPAALRKILNGTPTITVSILRSANGQEFVNVIVNE